MNKLITRAFPALDLAARHVQAGKIVATAGRVPKTKAVGGCHVPAWGPVSRMPEGVGWYCDLRLDSVMP